MAAHRARVPHREPREDALGVVDVLARQLTRLRVELKHFFAHGAVRVGFDVSFADLDRRHGLDRRL